MATVLRSATSIASDVEGLWFALASTVGHGYEAHVAEDGGEVRLRRGDEKSRPSAGRAPSS